MTSKTLRFLLFLGAFAIAVSPLGTSVAQIEVTYSYNLCAAATGVLAALKQSNSNLHKAIQKIRDSECEKYVNGAKYDLGYPECVGDVIQRSSVYLTGLNDRLPGIQKKLTQCVKQSSLGSPYAAVRDGEKKSWAAVLRAHEKLVTAVKEELAGITPQRNALREIYRDDPVRFGMVQRWMNENHFSPEFLEKRPIEFIHSPDHALQVRFGIAVTYYDHKAKSADRWSTLLPQQLSEIHGRLNEALNAEGVSMGVKFQISLFATNEAPAEKCEETIGFGSSKFFHIIIRNPHDPFWRDPSQNQSAKDRGWRGYHRPYANYTAEPMDLMRDGTHCKVRVDAQIPLNNVTVDMVVHETGHFALLLPDAYSEGERNYSHVLDTFNMNDIWQNLQPLEIATFLWTFGYPVPIWESAHYDLRLRHP